MSLSARIALLLALSSGVAASQSQIDFRIAGAYFRDGSGTLIPDESVLFQLVYLGPNGVSDPIPSGQWVGGDDVLVDLPFDGDYDTAAATDIDRTNTLSDGVFSRRYTIPVTSGVAETGGAFALRWYPNLSPEDYLGAVPLAGEIYGEVRETSGADVWVFPAAGALPKQFFAFDTVGAGDFGGTAIAGFDGLPNLSIEAGVWAEQERLPNDTRILDQDNLLNIGAGVAWQETGGTFEPVVVVIDSGIDASHPDLSGAIWINPLEFDGNGFDDDSSGYADDIAGWDFLGDDNNPDDLTGHGTHLAGLIAATRDNGFGVSGIAKRTLILPLKVGNATYSEAAVIEALDYVVTLKNRGVPIVAVNNSYVFESSDAPTVDTALKLAVERVCDAGILFVSSAGNQARDLDLDGTAGQPTYIYPANYDFDELIVVGGVEEDGDLYVQSNTGSAVNFFAPAVSVLSTEDGGGFGRRTGTSQAAAFVSGAIALFAEAAGHVDSDRIRFALESTLEDEAGLTGLGEASGILSLRRLAYFVAVDAWLAQNYGTDYPLDPAAELTADVDGNGLPNLLEFTLGLTPGAAQSGFQFIESQSAFSLEWEMDPSVRAFDYKLQTRSNLGTGDWVDVSEAEITYLGRSQDEERARLQYNVPNAAEKPQQFFRIRVARSVE